AQSEGDAPAHDRGTVLREKTLSRAPPATRRRAEGAERAEELVQPEPAREERAQGGHGEDDEAVHRGRGGQCDGELASNTSENRREPESAGRSEGKGEAREGAAWPVGRGAHGAP